MSESNIDNAKLIFCDTGVNIVTGGKFLGGTIGCKAAMDSFVSDKVAKWTDFVGKLSSMCISQPQSAYIGLTKSLQSEWIFLQRIMPNCATLFDDVEQALVNSFLPSVWLLNYTE